MSGRSERLHASTVAIGKAGVLIRGASGAGKSTLALRLIDAGAVLVADDQTILEPGPRGLVARAPAQLAGRLEVRGLGIVDLHSRARVSLALVVDLAAAGAIERLPEPEALSCVILGERVARVEIDAGDPAAVARVRVALGHLAGAPESRLAPLVSPNEQ